MSFNAEIEGRGFASTECRQLPGTSAERHLEYGVYQPFAEGGL